ncbi:hypothetical protein WA171_002993 [Blastocystis sp. BT1]
MQEKSLYADVDYSRGQINPRKEKELFITRLFRNLAYFLFFASLTVDYVYTSYTSYVDQLWDVFISCNVSYLLLLLFMSCEDPVFMFIFVIGFIGARCYTISLHQKYPVKWVVNPAQSSLYSLIFFFGFFILDQIVELWKSD